MRNNFSLAQATGALIFFTLVIGAYVGHARGAFVIVLCIVPLVLWAAVVDLKNAKVSGKLPSYLKVTELLLGPAKAINLGYAILFVLVSGWMFEVARMVISLK